NRVARTPRPDAGKGPRTRQIRAGGIGLLRARAPRVSRARCGRFEALSRDRFDAPAGRGARGFTAHRRHVMNREETQAMSANEASAALLPWEEGAGRGGL